MTFQYDLVLITGIIFIDLVLSNDNVIAISTAASLVPQELLGLSLSLSAIIATCLRLIGAQVVISILEIPFLQLLGGCLAFYIALQLLKNRRDKQFLLFQKLSAPSIDKALVQAGPMTFGQRLVQLMKQASGRKLPFTQGKFLLGISTIVLADCITSLDNIVAIGTMGATVRTSGFILTIGLILSKVLLYVGSALIAGLLRYQRWLIFVACLLLAVTGGKLIGSATERILDGASLYFGQWLNLLRWLIYGFCVLIVLIFTGHIHLPARSKLND